MRRCVDRREEERVIDPSKRDIEKRNIKKRY